MAIDITSEETTLFCLYVQKNLGIVLDQSKSYLLKSRLGPLVEKHQCSSFKILYQKVQTNKVIAQEVCDAVTTNETYFFREESTFELLKYKIIPEFLEKSDTLNIWSAACSFGQEPYSLAMILNEVVPNISDFNIQITATDVSKEAVNYASYGIYTQAEMARGLKPDRVRRHFQSDPKGYKVQDSIRGLVYFKEVNLLQPFPFFKKFDIIFCRNVLIYFDTPTKTDICNRFAKALNPNGILVVGASESLLTSNLLLQRKQREGVIYYGL